MNSKLSLEATNKNLKEALILQQRLLQQLYNELDVEREAAATAASEAMSMILRLQGEKAAVKMEAEQYKRLAEEKMNHAEESMEIFDEVMYQKEMEVASLDYTVQAYRYKLISLGHEDLGVNEVKYPEHLLQRNESLGETSNKNTPKRLKLPNLKKSPLERDRSINEDPDVIAKIVEESLHDGENNQNLDFGSGLGLGLNGTSSVDISSYLEQIRKLDKIVEDVAGEEFSFPSRCSSTPSKLNEMDIVPKKLIDDKIVSSSDTCSPGVHDVFEVPLVDETLYKNEGKTIFNDVEKVEKVKKLEAFPKTPEKSYYKDELDLLKKPLLSPQKEKRLFLPKKGMNADCHMALVQPTESALETQEATQETYMATEITEGESEVVEQNARQEPINTSNEQPMTCSSIGNEWRHLCHKNTSNEQELRLLYEINEKLDSIQSEIRSRNKTIDRSSPNCDLHMIQLSEAMSEFWL